MQLLKKLRERYTVHTHPDVTTTVAQSLIQLSSGIYTEDERFVFELLQNAIDSQVSDQKELNIRMQIKNGFFFFMHDGAEFSERDIEGLCDVGNGSKASDNKKIGYKGIGFKSVFMSSSLVYIKTGKYAFKFDKQFWNGYWENHWERHFGEQLSEKKYLMPWQIIPIEESCPIDINMKGWKVVTAIQMSHLDSLKFKVEKLLHNSQFLLFLQSHQINISFFADDTLLTSISKITIGEKVSIIDEGHETTNWLIHTSENLSIPPDVKTAIQEDSNTPLKLKEALSFDMSFAIQLESNNRLMRVNKSDAVIYTYLPTSFKFGDEGFPFLVNANFITDAGRQQLHKDSVWNTFLFSKLPSLFLEWIAQLSTDYPNYYVALPQKSYGNNNNLENAYSSSLKQAIQTIAFIPTIDNPQKKNVASNAIMDRLHITDVLSPKKIIKHLNDSLCKSYSLGSFTAPVWKGSKILADYGVHMIDSTFIKQLLDDSTLLEGMNVKSNCSLLKWLYSTCQKTNDDAKDLHIYLKQIPFIMNENDELCSPDSIFFQTEYKKENNLASEVTFIHPELIANLPHEVVTWLEGLGVKYLSNISFVEFLCDNSDYITVDNALEIGEFLFQIYQKEIIFDKINCKKLSKLKLLSQKCTLHNVEDLYLSDCYQPILSIESVIDEDIFVSQEYCQNGSVAEWKVFLLKLGLSDDIYLSLYGRRAYELDEYDCYDKDFFVQNVESANKYGWVSWEGFHLGEGYSFGASEVNYYRLPFTNRLDQFSISKVVLNRFFDTFQPIDLKDKDSSVSGYTGMMSRTINSSLLKKISCPTNYMDWILKSCAVIPTSKSNCLTAKEVFSNAIPQIKELAGRYLPIIEMEQPISDEWVNFLELKISLTIEDLLYVLEQIFIDTDSLDENKEKISLIYQRLADLLKHCSTERVDYIKRWAEKHQILCINGSFDYPKNLSYITLDGFKSNKRIYIGKQTNKDNLEKLFQIMGVQVITDSSIHSEFIGKQEASELPNIIMNKLGPIALIACGDKIDTDLYEHKKKEIRDLINATIFYHCDRIIQTYGNSEDVVQKHSFGRKNEFYYTGNLRPANVEPLLSPICSYLSIKGLERELFIIMIEDIIGIRQNLADKGYNITYLVNERIETGSLVVKLNYTPNLSMQEQNLLTGFKGEILVYEYLRVHGYTPICPSISTKDDFDRIIEMNGKTYYCKINYDKYDIHIKSHLGKDVYIEVKATTCSKLNQENMPISYNELSMIESCSLENEKIYIIARVFGIETPQQQDIYFFKGCLDSLRVHSDSDILNRFLE